MVEPYLNKYLQSLRDTMLTRPCYYMSNSKICQSNIRRVTIEMEPNFGIKTVAYLSNGTHVVIHTADSPYFVGQTPWGFLSKAECIEYWDM